MRTLPGDAYVYFYSDRHPLRLETASSSRRTSTRGPVGGVRPFPRRLDRDRRPRAPGLFVLLGRYGDLLPALESAYPDGRAVTATCDGVKQFVAYRWRRDDRTSHDRGASAQQTSGQTAPPRVCQRLVVLFAVDRTAEVVPGVQGPGKRDDDAPSPDASAAFTVAMTACGGHG